MGGFQNQVAVTKRKNEMGQEEDNMFRFAMGLAFVVFAFVLFVVGDMILADKKPLSSYTCGEINTHLTEGKRLVSLDLIFSNYYHDDLEVVQYYELACT